MRKEIVLSFQFEGLHEWPDAPVRGEYYLKNIHRHLFKARCWKEVTHSDRDIEFIKFKREIYNFLIESNGGNIINFGHMSCEHIAEHLLQKFKLSKCEVLEDGENGAVITA